LRWPSGSGDVGIPLGGWLKRTTPASGYELTRQFNQALGVWCQALPNEIYPELRRLGAEGPSCVAAYGNSERPGFRDFCLAVERQQMARTLPVRTMQRYSSVGWNLTGGARTAMAQACSDPQGSWRELSGLRVPSFFGRRDYALVLSLTAVRQSSKGSFLGAQVLRRHGCVDKT
jgi:hypothetical protein